VPGNRQRFVVLLLRRVDRFQGRRFSTRRQRRSDQRAEFTVGGVHVKGDSQVPRELLQHVPCRLHGRHHQGRAGMLHDRVVATFALRLRLAAMDDDVGEWLRLERRAVTRRIASRRLDHHPLAAFEAGAGLPEVSFIDRDHRPAAAASNMEDHRGCLREKCGRSALPEPPTSSPWQ